MNLTNPATRRRDTAEAIATRCRRSHSDPHPHGTGEAAHRSPYGRLKRRRAFLEIARGTVVAALSLAVLLAAPKPSHATPIGALKLVVAAVEVLGTIGTAAEALDDIFDDVADVGDDHPLYGSGNTFPTLSIVATETELNLFLDQPNEISAFEDDYLATLSGTMLFNDGQSDVPVWKFSLTFTAELFLSNAVPSTLSVSGFVQHIRKPSGAEHLNDAQQGPALDLDVDVSSPESWHPATNIVATSLDTQTHPGADHQDKLTASRLEATCCTQNFKNFLGFDYRMTGEHVAHAPEPSTALLLAGGLVGLAVVGRRR